MLAVVGVAVAMATAGAGEPAAGPTVSGWAVWWNSASLERFEREAPRIAEVLPEWFMVEADGAAARRPGWTDETRGRLREAAKRHGVRVLGMASNFADGGFQAARLQRVIADPARRTAHAEALASMAAEDGLDGIDLDYESLEAADREGFSALVEAIAARTRAKGLTLSVTLHAKTAEPGTWGGPQAQDYARIGRAADVVRIMVYDQSWAGSDPGPIAADAWAESVMTFAASVIPPAKLELGIAGYGYDWSTRPAKSLTWADWGRRDGERTDPASGESVAGEARFSGSESNRRKLALARRLGLRGVSLWYIGSEDPALWEMFPKRR